MSTPVDMLAGIMDDLRACLCGFLEASGHPTPCLCSLYPGQVVGADWCGCGKTGQGCGQAWVRLSSIFPSKVFPLLDNTAGACTSPLAAVIELGVFRCLPQPTSAGVPPNAVALSQTVLLQLDDAGAMHDTLRCCDALAQGVRPSMLGTYTPVSAGDCGGGVWPVTVHLVRGR